MTEFSDESDVNPSEMERMVEDLDDLDNTLLGSSLKKDQFTTNKDFTEVKKKVAFKDFDNDDPLADLLSDDEPYETKKQTATGSRSNFVADLFGIKGPKLEEKPDQPIKAQNLLNIQKNEGTRENNFPTDSSSAVISKKTQIFTEERISQSSRDKSRINEEIKSQINEAPKREEKLLSSKARKSSLMEDLLGARSAPNKEIDSRLNFPKLSAQNSQNSVPPESSKSEQSMKSSSGYSLDSGSAREPRRGRRNSTFVSDPLGLFSVSKSEAVDQPVKEVEKKVDFLLDNKVPEEDLPEWLGGTGKTKETKTENQKINENVKNAQELTEDISWQKNSEAIFNPDLSTIMSTQFDQQATLISMQQQENELKTAAMLSHQNDQVSKIVENQKAKLNEQAKMFNVLIKHQMERQAMLETQMKLQQSRLDQYIQTLMAQPTSLRIGAFDEKNVKEPDEKEERAASAENLVKKLELENAHLENTITMLREKHEREVSILQESYEKEISFLREEIEKLKKKMFEDCESLEADCYKKMDKLKREMEQMENEYKEEIDILKKNEKILVEQIYDRHSHNVEILQRAHTETIEEISRAKEIEKKAIQTINSHKTDLGDLLQRSELIIESFQNLQKKVEEKDVEFGDIRGSYLKKQEEHLQLLRDQLNLQQDSLKEERKSLLEIFYKLDAGTAHLTSEFKKNSSTITETEERLVTRERALLREKQLFDEQMKWEREHLQAMKEAWIKEQERQMKWISDERESVANERAKLDVLNKLKSSEEAMTKIELDAALKTAEEAANDANQEKKRWQEKCRTLDAAKESLREKERHLVKRAKELEALTQSALIKREEGLQALKEAKRIEERHKEHLNKVETQLESLTNRENRRALEKLASEMYPAEKPEKDTEMHITSIHENEKSRISNSYVSTHFKDIVDPHLLLLKLNLDNKMKTTDELLATMQVISQ